MPPQEMSTDDVFRRGPTNPYESPRAVSGAESGGWWKIVSRTALIVLGVPALANTLLLFAITENNFNMRDSLFGILPMPPMIVRIWSYHTLPFIALPAFVALIIAWIHIPTWLRIMLIPVTLFCALWTWYAIYVLLDKYN
jgi:hypothetical protein